MDRLWTDVQHCMLQQDIFHTQNMHIDNNKDKETVHRDEDMAACSQKMLLEKIRR